MVYQVLTYLHISFAILAIIFGVIAITSMPKGNKLHRTSGTVYFFSYLISCFLGLVMLTIKFKSILLGLTILNIYLVISGYLSTGKHTQKKYYTRMAMLPILLFVIAFLSLFSRIQTEMVWKLVFYFFIGLTIYVAISDFSLLKGGVTSVLKEHLEKMLLSFVALIGGICIQVFTSIIHNSYSWVLWIIAYFLCLPLISIWSRRLRMGKVKIGS